MEYQHRDGEAAPTLVSLTPVRDDVAVDDDGVFEIDEDRDDFEAVHERLVDVGHEPLDDAQAAPDDGDAGTSAETTDDDGAGDADVNAEPTDSPQASDYTEEELTEMDRDDLRRIARHYDDINGNASGEDLTDALIEQRREELEEE